MRLTPCLSLFAPCLALVGVLSVAPQAWAEDASAEQAPGDDLTRSDDTASTAEEKEAVQASPDVQSQVGVGTEKEEETRGGTYDPTSPFQEAEHKRRKRTYGHGLQFGLRPGIVFPYKVQFRFDDSPQCDAVQDGMTSEGKSTCGFVSAPQTEIALSFAPFDSLEPFIWARFGLRSEEQTRTAPAMIVGGGLRFYTMNEAKFKLFFEVAAGVQLEGATDPNLEDNLRYDPQFLGRLGFGPQFDFNRYIGLYASVGPGVSTPRAITMQLEANAGLQVRIP